MEVKRWPPQDSFQLLQLAPLLLPQKNPFPANRSTFRMLHTVVVTRSSSKDSYWQRCKIFIGGVFWLTALLPSLGGKKPTKGLLNRKCEIDSALNYLWRGSFCRIREAAVSRWQEKGARDSLFLPGRENSFLFLFIDIISTAKGCSFPRLGDLWVPLANRRVSRSHPFSVFFWSVPQNM